MKFMKLGSKPDLFQSDGENIRYAQSELATDITIRVGEVKFHLHKFPLLSKSACLQKLVSTSTKEDEDDVSIQEIPGGPAAFEICAKFCYGMAVTLNAYNVVSIRCAAEYLEMHESVENGNLIRKIEVFLNSTVFRTWKDSIIVLKTTPSIPHFSNELKIVSRCIDSISYRATLDTSKVDWSYTCSRKKLSEENENMRIYDGTLARPTVPKDWWVEDLCELDTDLYKGVMIAIKAKGIAPDSVIGLALKMYAFRKLPGFRRGVIDVDDLVKARSTVDMIVWLLPEEKVCVSCTFLIGLLKASIFVDSDESTRVELIRRIGKQLEEASVNDILMKAPEGESTMYNVGIVQKLVEEFCMQRESFDSESRQANSEIHEITSPEISLDASKLMVALLIDGYLLEISKDPNLPMSKFLNLAEMVSSFARPTHDRIYQAIDTYLKEHPGLSKGERKRICRLMDCKKLSADTSMHAMQNERLPLRVVVQLLFFEQVRAARSSGSMTPDLPKVIKELSGSFSSQSSKSGTTNGEDWDAEELKAVEGKLGLLKSGGQNGRKTDVGKIKRMLTSKKVFLRLWSGNKRVDMSGSDSSGSLGSANQQAPQSTPRTDRRHSVS